MKRFEISFSGGASYATSRTVFLLGTSFSYYLTDKLAFSFDLGVAYHIPYLDFAELLKVPTGYSVAITVYSQYRIFSSLGAEYSFDISPEFKPFITIGVGWCRDCLNFHLGASKLQENGTGWEEINSIPFSLNKAIVCSEGGNCKYRKSGFPLLLIGAGFRHPLGSKTSFKVMARALNPGGEFSTYQLVISWGIRF
ncbi:MAG: hypothetical protein J7L64_09170 [Acidobacteria bacterium]|nr:hypothetical protein [Acidobacteriota bacterium]